jgi:response regulator RpfG family c-di-GMP phosphodiesterase
MSKKYKILIVDDEQANLRLLDRLLSSEFEILTASSAAAGLEILDHVPVAMIISDQRMPGMTGVEFLKRAAVTAPQTVRIILTGYTDAEALVDALNSGVVYKYITKPWINSDLKTTIQRGLQHHETLNAQRTLQRNYLQALDELDEAQNTLPRFCSALLQLVDPVAHIRAERIAALASDIAQELGHQQSVINELELAIFTRAVLTAESNAGATKSEGNLNKLKFFEAGMRAVGDLPNTSNAVKCIRHITERFDGSGYPSRLAENDIPLESRIAAIAIAFDKMVFPAAGEPEFTHAEAVSNVLGGAGTRFDPEITAAFGRVIQRDREETPKLMQNGASALGTQPLAV